MPYIPPPPRPPAPPRIPAFKPPPVFKPPGPSFQQQNFQRQQQFQQQQQFQRQQQFHRQQQQDAMRRNQQIQADNTRRQQQQQQFHRQQQQEQFRRQQQIHQQNQQHIQDNLKRQHQLQQDNLRRQQEQHRRQQEVLRNLQSTSVLGGSNKVFVSPNFPFSAPSGGGADGGFQMTGDGFTSSAGGIQINAQGIDPSCFTFSTSMDDSSDEDTGPPSGNPPPFPDAASNASPLPAKAGPPPSNGFPPPSGNFSPPPGNFSPPPYPGPPPPLGAAAPPPGVAPFPFLQMPVPASTQFTLSGPQAPGPPSERIVLADGTQIFIQKEKCLFVGPTGRPMEVNCLPLYEPSPGAVASATAVTTASSTSPETREPMLPPPSFIDDSKLLKQDPSGHQKSDEQWPQQPPELQDPEPSQQTPEQEPKASSQTASTADIKEPQSEGAVGEAEVEESPVKSKDEVAAAETGDCKPHHLVMKKESLGGQSDDGSDDEKPKNDQLLVEYIDSPDELTIELKRSSGSVSFFGAQEDLAPYPAPKSPPPDLPTIEQSTELLSTDISAAAAPLDGSGEKSRENTGETGASSETEPPQNCGSETSPKSEAVDDEVVAKEQPVVQEEKSESQEKTASEKEEQLQDPPAAKAEPEGSRVEAKPSSDSEKPPLLEDATTQASQPGVHSAPGTLPAAQGASPPPAQPAPLPSTPLPPPPPTVEPVYTDRSGWLTKLSHKKGVFGDKWQKRYFVLHKQYLYYFKKYGDSNPRGAILLLPSSWCKSIPQGTPRMADAVANCEENRGVISVLRCMAVHRPNNYASSLSSLLATDGVADIFHSQTISVNNPEYSSRTFYMIASSNEEREAWVHAIDSNIKAYAYSPDALATATGELSSMLRAVHSTFDQSQLSSLLLLLHQKIKALASPNYKTRALSKTQ